MMKRLCCLWLLILAPFAHADWATDRAGETGYVTVTTLASVIDEAVPFCVVYLSDMPSAFWTAMDAAGDTDGKTIRTASADGSTQLPCVPLGVNTGTDTGCLIFLGTGMSASVDVDYRIYVGNAALSMPTASGGMGEQAVFAAYAAVYFPGMATRDFTSGGRTLTAVNSPGTAAWVEGINAATYVKASTQYHKYEGTQAVTDWPITMEANVYPSVITGTEIPVLLSKFSSGTNLIGWYRDNANYYAAVQSDGAGSGTVATGTMAATTYYDVVITRDSNSGDTQGYKDATQYTNGANINTPATYDRFAIGAGAISSSYTLLWGGRVGWVGISSSVRSANFVATQRQNWLGNLYSVGSWTPNSVAPGTTGWVLFQTAATTSASGTLVDWVNVSNALVDDATYASAVNLNPSANFETETLKLTNPAYGVTIPAGAPSYTVEFRVKRAASLSSPREIYDLNVQFIDNTGTLTGTNAAAPGIIWPTTAASYEYVMTGLTLDDTKFTSASGLAFSAYADGSSSNCDARVLTAWIKVSWTGTDTLAGTRGFFALTE